MNPDLQPTLPASLRIRRSATKLRTLKSTQVIDLLGSRIVAGVLPPGTLLPTEADLSSQLGISRPSLREGLRALAQKGLVEGRTRRGTTVNDRRQWNVLDADVLRWLSEAATTQVTTTDSGSTSSEPSPPMPSARRSLTVPAPTSR